jgi:hypothetical protein
VIFVEEVEEEEGKCVLSFNDGVRNTAIYRRTKCRMDVRDDAVVAYYELLFKNYLGMIEIDHEKHQERTLCALKKIHSAYS